MEVNYIICIMSDLKDEFGFCFRKTTELYIDIKNFVDNIGSTNLIPKSITKQEILYTFYLTINACFTECNEDEILLHDTILYRDKIFETAMPIFNMIYPKMESYLTNEKNVIVNIE